MYAIARSCFVRRKSIGSCVACELFLIHCAIYYFISSGMTPFAFYMNGGIYALAVMAVGAMVCIAMLFRILCFSYSDIICVTGK